MSRTYIPVRPATGSNFGKDVAHSPANASLGVAVGYRLLLAGRAAAIVHAAEQRAPAPAVDTNDSSVGAGAVNDLNGGAFF